MDKFIKLIIPAAICHRQSLADYVKECRLPHVTVFYFLVVRLFGSKVNFDFEEDEPNCYSLH
jgi:hypothetical protein